MSGRKHARVCAGCHEPKPARYRTLLDRHLCEDCYRTPTVATGVVQVGPVMAVTQPAPAVDAPDLELFDLSHLVSK